MLAEFLADQGDWTSVMPGARACLFSLDERPGPLPLQLEHLHFETLFCLRGSVTLTRQDGSFLKAGAQQVLLLTDLAGFTGANVDVKPQRVQRRGVPWRFQHSSCAAISSVLRVVM